MPGSFVAGPGAGLDISGEPLALRGSPPGAENGGMIPGPQVLLRRIAPLLALVAVLLAPSRARADGTFSQGLTPDQFQAAGLGKLTPDELARLDALVASRVSGQVQARVQEQVTVVQEQVKAQAREEAKAEVAATVQEQVQAQVDAQVKAKVAAAVKAHDDAQAKAAVEARAKTGSALLGRIEAVILRPGTHIEYTTLESEIRPGFHGWHKGTILTLVNGQRWQVSDEGQYVCPHVNAPVKVKVVPGVLGSFFMEIEHGGRPRVKFIDDAPMVSHP